MHRDSPEESNGLSVHFLRSVIDVGLVHRIVIHLAFQRFVHVNDRTFCFLRHVVYGLYKKFWIKDVGCTGCFDVADALYAPRVPDNKTVRAFEVSPVALKLIPV